jgi:hypothetical protein
MDPRRAQIGRHADLDLVGDLGEHIYSCFARDCIIGGVGFPAAGDWVRKLAHGFDSP